MLMGQKFLSILYKILYSAAFTFSITVFMGAVGLKRAKICPSRPI